MDTQGRQLLITGSRVYTGSRSKPWAEAVLTEGDRIAFVGSDDEARDRASNGVGEIHVDGGLVTAGLNDSHIHTEYGAYALTTLNLEGVFTLPELQRRLREYADAHPNREWIEGYSLFYEPMSGLDIPEREALDAAVGNRPVYIRAFDFHSAWCNTEGLRRAGIERGANVEPPNEVVVDPRTGLATGMLKEGAKLLVDAVIAEPSEDQMTVMLRDACRYLNSLGITSVQNMNGNLTSLERWARLRDRDDLTVRVYTYMNVREEMPRDYLNDILAYTRQYTDEWNRAAGVKLFIDGVVEAKTAWMLDSYSDGSGDTGVPDLDPDAYREIVVESDRLGMDVATHAIGSRGIRSALDAYEAAQNANGGRRGRRHRVEHIEAPNPSDLDRFGRLDVTASMQPLHAAPTSDPRFTPWTQLIGPEREVYAFPWRTLVETGARLSYGSDWPVVTPDVRVGLHTAVTRQNPAGLPAGGWHPQHSVTLAQAIDAYTSGAAYAQQQESIKGTIEPGKVADLTVFARDLFTLQPNGLMNTDIALTVVGGRVVHQGQTAGSDRDLRLEAEAATR